MFNKKRLVVCAVAVLGVGAYLNTLPVHAEVVPSFRTAYTEVVGVRLENGDEVLDFLERDGDADVDMWFGANYQTVNVTFHGDGSLYTEDGTICDDAICGDVYFTTFTTNGTITHDDDTIMSLKYLGTIVPNNYKD